TAVIFGKSWTLHVFEVLRASKEENLDMIYDTIDYLKRHGIEVIFDAEHFFQGFKEDPEYAMSVLKVAEEAGARVLVLADTNGGMMPWDVYDIVKHVIRNVKTVVGVHMHNDSGCAVANTLIAVYAGARHVQGTINGIGERTGNADLIQIIPSIRYKLGLHILKNDDNLKRLRELSQLVYRITGISPNPYQPYVGEFAFAHKAGVHVDAVLKNPRAYEHIDPGLVGNTRKFIVSELSGAANIVALLKEFGIEVDKRDERIKRIITRIKDLEKQGYTFDKASASALLIALKELGYKSDGINKISWTIFSSSAGTSIGIADVDNVVGKAIDVDPVRALVSALFDVLKRIYAIDDELKMNMEIMLIQDKMFRVTINFSNSLYTWSTQALSLNIFDAIAKAFIDGIEYYSVLKTIKHGRQWSGGADHEK
ncbi:MAG: citramalate synthase, partial [Ignisphaera sp.]